jgi:type VI protein secretion system component VasK
MGPQGQGHRFLLAGLWMRRWIFLVLGVLLALAGLLWIGQGLNMMGQSGGMNGQHIWAVIGLVCVVAGLGLITAGVRARRAARLPGAR